MPRVYLTQAERADAKEAREMEVMTVLIRTASGRLCKQNKELADIAGVHPVTFTRLKQSGHVAKTDFQTVRRVAHAVGCTPEEWLKIGGFK